MVSCSCQLGFLSPLCLVRDEIVSFFGNWCCSKNNNSNELQKQKDPYDAWEVKFDDVTISEEIGQGAFGKVYKGTLKEPLSKKKSLRSTTAVAVKVLQGKLQRVWNGWRFNPTRRDNFCSLQRTYNVSTTLDPWPSTKLTLNWRKPENNGLLRY